MLEGYQKAYFCTYKGFGKQAQTIHFHNARKKNPTRQSYPDFPILE